MTDLQQPSVIVLGGINMDLVTVSHRFPAPGETVLGSRFLTYPGGKGANQAVAAARMGAPTAMVGRVGDDVFGPQVTGSLAAAGVDVSGVGVESGVSSGVGVINIDASAQNQIVQVLGANDTCGDAEAERVRGFLNGALALLLQLEVSLELSLQMAREASSMGKAVVLDPGPVRPLPEEFYRLCHIITPNETEAQALVGFPVVDLSSAARAASALLERGAQVAVIKMGAMGAYFATGEGGEYVPPFEVEAVDSVAAGDAFNGALAASLVAGKGLKEAVVAGAAAGALAVTRHGAQGSMPLQEEVEVLLRENPR